MKEQPQYPIKKIDSLNRLIYIDFDGYERILNKYWGDTNLIKIKYRFFGSEIEIEAFDVNRKIIMYYSTGMFKFHLTDIKIDNNNLSFVVDKNKLFDWRKRLKKK
jgi:hypothetical protein